VLCLSHFPVLVLLVQINFFLSCLGAAGHLISQSSLFGFLAAQISLSFLVLHGRFYPSVFFSPAPALESSLDLFFVAVPARGPSAPDRVALLACPFPAEQVSSLPGARAQTSSSCFFLVLSLSDPFARVEFYLEILPP
jgi:hypothetical protein